MLGLAGVLDLPQHRVVQTQVDAQLVDGLGEAAFTGDHRAFRAHDGQGQEAAVVAAQSRQQTRPQKRRLPGPRGAENHE
jgi:hypothetical protein